METFLIKAAQLVTALVLLVTVHEFGHYIFARIFGIRVNRFYLFFNPWFSLLKYFPDKGKLQLIAWTKKTKEGTEDKALLTLNTGRPIPDTNKKGRPSWAATLYGLGWLPLGGYCEIAGMVDETTSAKDLGDEVKPWEFRSRPAYQRFMVMVAGVVFNFLTAIIIYAGIAFHWGDRMVPFHNAYEGMNFAKPMLDAGFKNGDVLLTINGDEFNTRNISSIWKMIQPGAHVKILRNHTDTLDIIVPATMLDSVAKLQVSPVEYRVPVFAEQVQHGGGAQKAGLLDGDRIVAVANDTTPSLSEFFPALEKVKGTTADIKVLRDGKLLTFPVEISDAGKIGIMLRPIDRIYEVEEVKYNIFEAIPRGIHKGTDQLVTYVQSLKLVFSKEGAQQVGGFGTLGSLFPDTWNWYMFWELTAFLSVILAFMNIIPIPALDGGYVMFLLWEMVSGRKPSDKFLETANTVGFVFLFLLLIYANGNDIIRMLF